MKKRIIYLLVAAIGTIGFNSCGTTQNRTATGPATGTNAGTATGTTTTTTGTRAGTTGTPTTGTTTGATGTTRTTTGTTTGTTTATTGDRAATTTGTTVGQSRNQTGTTQGMQTSQYQLQDRTDYTLNNERYTFSPDRDGNINVTRDQDGRQTPYGTMRRTGDGSGYYIMNRTDRTTGEDDVSFGRFDDQGNFRTYRYDRESDSVVEGDFRTTRPAGNSSPAHTPRGN